ncbi:hypothetical protein [Stenotrophomonas sp.]|uniref:hypothetical protein n=1 Tax=Stenotrophomonas sp. TaxID=69392 RepID=UPI0031E0E823
MLLTEVKSSAEWQLSSVTFVLERADARHAGAHCLGRDWRLEKTNEHPSLRVTPQQRECTAGLSWRPVRGDRPIRQAFFSMEVRLPWYANPHRPPPSLQKVTLRQ